MATQTDGIYTEVSVDTSQLRDSVKAVQGAVGAIGSELQSVVSGADGAGAAVSSMGAEFKAISAQVGELSKTLNSVSSASSSAAESSRNITAALEAQRAGVANYIAKLKEENDTLGLNAQELSEYTAKKLGASESDRKVISNLVGQIEAFRANAKAIADNSAALDAAAAKQQAQRDNISQMVKQLEFQAATLGKTTRQIILYKAAKDGATASEKKSIIQSLNAIEAYERKTEATRKSNMQMSSTAQGVQRSFGGVRGAAQNLGWQLQDTVVQLQAGTSGFTVLAQQGSQLASAFGPGGAVIGAVIAVAAVIGGVLFTSLNKTSAEIKEEFLPNVKDLKENLDQLSKAQASVAIMQIKEEMKPLPDIARAAAAQVEYLTKQIEKFPSNKDVKKWNDELVVQQAIFDGVGQKIKELNKDQESFLDVIKRNINGTQGQQDADKKRIETLEDLLMATEQQAAIAGLTQRGIALYVAEQAKASEADIKRINAAYDLIEAEEKKKDGTKEGAKEDRAKTKALDSVVSGLDEQYQKLIMTTDAYEEYAAVQQAEAANATPAQIAAIRAKVKALQDERKAIQENVDLQDEIAENEKSEAEQKKKITTEFESVKTAVRGELETPAQQADRELAERQAIIQQYGDQERLTQAQIDAYKIQAAAATEKKITEQRKQEEDARRAAAQSTLSSFGDMFGNLADIAREGGEKTFKQYKLLASAQAAISAALAVTNVLANPLIPYPLNVGLAASVGALAAVQIAKIQGQQYGGGRLYGGPVAAGKMYPVNENGAPEIFQQGNRQYLMPNARGEVVSNKDATNGAAGGFTLNYSPTIYAQQADFEEIMASQPEAIYNAVSVALASRGRNF